MRPQTSVGWWLGTHRGRDEWDGIKGRVDLARVVTALLGPPAKRQGRRLLWLCPFHDDRHPSFEVDPRRGTWKCWPCNVGGDAPALVMRLSRVGFPEAVRVVAELSGIVVVSGRSAGRITSPGRRRRTRSPGGRPARRGSDPRVCPGPLPWPSWTRRPAASGAPRGPRPGPI